MYVYIPMISKKKKKKKKKKRGHFFAHFELFYPNLGKKQIF